MATGYLSPIGMIIQLLSDQGVVGNGYQIYTYVAGTVNTSVTTYTASNLVTPNSNPIVMGPNGRFQNVSVWAPAGTLIKMVITDNNNNVIAGGTIDNIPLINDVSAIFASFSNPAAGSGVDLVANALKSYAVVANVQASPVPTISAGQTLVIMVEGKSAAGDGLAGLYYWSASSTAADDGGVTTIAPAGPPVSGRYLRLVLPYSQLGSGLYVPQYLVKSTNNVITSNSTLTNDPTLQVTLVASQVYLVEAFLNLLGTTSTGQGYKVAMSFAGTPVAGFTMGVWEQSTNGGTPGFVQGNLGTAVTSVSVSDSNGDVANWRGVISVASAGGGLLAVQVAQAASNANATTLLAGSALRVTRIL